MKAVHYCAHGRNGLIFGCYVNDTKRHMDSLEQYDDPKLPGWKLNRHTIPTPLKTTDVSKVTCVECLTWLRSEIASLLARRGRCGAAGSILKRKPLTL